jgi:hypothetical protein
MKDFIYIKENSVHESVCDNIIELFEKYPEYQYDGCVGDVEYKKCEIKTDIDKNLKDTKDLNILNMGHIDEWNVISKTLIENLENNLCIYISLIKDKFSIDLTTQFQSKSIHSLLIHKYEKQKGKFSYHNDSLYDHKNKKYRILNYLWYLNDVDIGGETEFFGFYKIKPKKGNLIIFPSEWLFPHTGKIPISSDKYVVSGWIYVEK